MAPLPADPPAAEPRAAAVAADPDVVWHYTDGHGLISILRGHCLWATASAFLNDQHEVGIGMRRLADRLVRVAENAELRARLAEWIDPRLTAGPAHAQFFILSASQAWDSLAMWRLYGGARESYAIGLDATARLGVLGDGTPVTDAEFGAAGVYLKRQPWERVRYTADDQDRLVDAVFDELPVQLDELRRMVREAASDAPRWAVLSDGGRPVLRELLDNLEQAVLLIKHEGFVDEREVRQGVVLAAGPGRGEAPALVGRLLRYRATAYGIAPYLCLTGGAGDDAVVPVAAPLPIRAVALSPSPNGPAAVESVRSVLAATGYGDVPVLRSSIPFRG